MLRLILCVCVFRAIINHFNPKIESYAAVNHISQLSEDQVLEVVRSNYDTLTLKLQDGLDQFERYSEQPKEAAFFKELVRGNSRNTHTQYMGHDTCLHW
uniref:Armadillo-like helical domain-containing protein n=1 Tax=Hucho hucho TaxID=62062 RepID=A0A4W5JIL2_9TELE